MYKEKQQETMPASSELIGEIMSHAIQSVKGPEKIRRGRGNKWRTKEETLSSKDTLNSKGF